MLETGTIQKVRKKIRHGMIPYILKTKLTRLGIDIFPFYLFQVRQSFDCVPPKVRDANPDAYEVAILTEEDIHNMDVESGFFSRAELQEWIRRNSLCIGVKHHGKTVSYQLFNLSECHIPAYPFRLKNNEAYGFALYTMESYKGKNIAGFSTWHCLEILLKRGIDTMYIVNDCLNTATLRVTRKYNAKPFRLILHISLFNKLRQTWVLKSYQGFS